MEHFYHIRCDPDLDGGFFAMWRIPCACTRCVEQPSKPWLSNLDKILQPRYVIRPETCNYYSILRGYNKWYICQIDLKKETANPDKMDIKDELILNCMNWVSADEIKYNTMGEFKFSDSNMYRYYIVLWTGN